jgi:hypothetical protein
MFYQASVSPQYTRVCPYCGNPDCHAEYVDIGVGLLQCGPFQCPDCFATEIGPHDPSKELTESEKKTGWYEPVFNICED